MDVTLRNELTAPEEARDLLAMAKAKYGFVPNLLAVMANAPPLLKSYMTLSSLFETTSLTPTERQVVLLSVSTRNQCGYCVAAHTMIASMQDVPADVVEAIRAGQPITDPKLAALRRFAEEVTTTRGWPSPTTVERFLDAGYTEAQALEVLIGVGMKTISNYTNHLAGTPLDRAFAVAEWEPAGATSR
ncbi:MAG: carboxymuconolactone decarboxylase family protein [Bryobacterales bacterium]|nr:carboxymuconolactone decarboxylase family protein [Bryobacterales bacterium]